ncbi:hypothetical protein F4806DRAFT_149631 [Annulohypoxylon nitens]|nr:hypothetical protein F4806DRAFT_149631 [Annulohypoxylon nitens]
MTNIRDLPRGFKYTFNVYAISHWMSHCIISKNIPKIGPSTISPGLVEIMLPLCQVRETLSSTGFDNWLETVQICGHSVIDSRDRDWSRTRDPIFGGYRYLLSKGYFKSTPRPPIIFCLACEHGIENLVASCVDEGPGTVPYEWYEWGITFACLGNQLSIAQKLLRKEKELGTVVEHRSVLLSNLSAFYCSEAELFKMMMEPERQVRTITTEASNDEISLDIQLLLEVFTSYWESWPSPVERAIVNERLRCLVAQMSRPSDEQVVGRLINGALGTDREDLVTSLSRKLSGYGWHISPNIASNILQLAEGNDTLRNIVMEQLVRDCDIDEQMMTQVLQKANIIQTSETIINLFNRNKDICVSKDMINLAIKNRWASRPMIQFLLGKVSKLAVSSVMIMNALRRSVGIVIELLKHDEEFQLSEDEFKLAIRMLPSSIPWNMQENAFLYSRRQNPELELDEDIVVLIVNGRADDAQKIELLDLLFSHQTGLIVSEKALLHALQRLPSPELIRKLLECQRPRTTPTEAVMREACRFGSDIWKVILELRPESVFTEDVIRLSVEER